MGTFGDKLKREREMRAITLEEIAEATKIGTRSLRALEEERFNLLPGGIFNKGFVRAYAKYLGLDEEQLVADYLVASGEHPEGNLSMAELSQQMEAAREREREEARRRRRTHPLVVTLVIIAVIAGAVYGGRYWYKQREAARETARILEEQAAEARRQTAQAAAQAAVQAAKPPATQEAPITVQLKATEKAWISVTADGKLVAQETLDASNPQAAERTFEAQKTLVVVIGNPAALQAWFNGKPIESLGTSGKPVTLTFTPSGMQQGSSPQSVNP